MLRLSSSRLCQTSLVIVNRTIASSFSTVKPNEQPASEDKALSSRAQEAQTSSQIATQRPKTIAEQDAEVMRKLAGHADEGGAAGIEYEDGKPVAMKRSVKNNMFRLI